MKLDKGIAMGTFKEWRHSNPVWNQSLRKFNFFKRGCRTVIAHPILYWRYSQQCHASPIAKQIAMNQECVNLALRPFNKYLNKHWTSRHKILAAMGTLRVLEKQINLATIKQLFGSQVTGITLATLSLKNGEQAQIKLMHSRFVREGEMGIYLFAPGCQEPLYSLTFSFDHLGETLYLCGLQGPKPGEGQDQVREMTKALFGIRPKNILLSAAYALADSFSIKEVRGVADSHHIKSHHLKSSYNNFWEEVSQDVSGEGWYCLPRHETVRDIEQVESKHRSAFRKREALRQQMIADIGQSLQRISGQTNRVHTASELVVSNA